MIEISGSRERAGARISWNVLNEPRLTQMWNPWSKDIPWIVFVSHPLLASGIHFRVLITSGVGRITSRLFPNCTEADQHNARFDVQDFLSNLRDATQAPMSKECLTMPQSTSCLVEYRPILMESYVGLPALVHNYGQFGYYKNRGKISF